MSWDELDESLITSEVCLQCGKCCKTTWTQDRFTKGGADRLPYLQAMFGRSARTFVEAREKKVACVNWCSQLMPDLKCNIYQNRPQMCIDFNCFKEANGRKRLPEFWTHIKKLVERVHGTSPYKGRDEDPASTSSSGGLLGRVSTDALEDG